uniref:Testican-3 n=1 Tax=Ursus americanus TaxID=9643 RepID=A0A452QNA4_URSAM
MLKVSAVLCVCAAAWCSQALAAAAAVAAAGGRSDGGNFLDDKQWLTTISQYDKEVGQWNKFRDVSAAGYFHSPGEFPQGLLRPGQILRRLFALESVAVTCQSFFPTCSECSRGRAAGLRSAVHLQAFNLVVPVRWLPWQLMTAPSPPFKTRKARKEARVIHRHTANLYCDI